MDYLVGNWLPLLAAALAGFIAGRITAKTPEQRQQEARAYQANLRQNRARLRAAVSEEVRTLVREGKKIEAIKLVRQDLGIGLKEAKDLVEGLE